MHSFLPPSHRRQRLDWIGNKCLTLTGLDRALVSAAINRVHTAIEAGLNHHPAVF
ncbi:MULTISPECIES: hypothetical protein [unclassified Limnothrix]|uniref:hypothetical protein n=1 Tax=unclassified Limnothrix TaxID=2632864 RepID=UPI001686A7AC|nr:MULTISPECIES: hypothetical protein [unclassified Limnothrix]MBD2589609.1 hypothetical protein [Limnothrix sp. FACHB-406]